MIIFTTEDLFEISVPYWQKCVEQVTNILHIIQDVKNYYEISE